MQNQIGKNHQALGCLLCPPPRPGLANKLCSTTLHIRQRSFQLSISSHSQTSPWCGTTMVHLSQWSTLFLTTEQWSHSRPAAPRLSLPAHPYQWRYYSIAPAFRGAQPMNSPAQRRTVLLQHMVMLLVNASSFWFLHGLTTVMGNKLLSSWFKSICLHGEGKAWGNLLWGLDIEERCSLKSSSQETFKWRQGLTSTLQWKFALERTVIHRL